MGRHRRSKKRAKKLAKRRQQERRRIERRAALVLDALRAPEDGSFVGVDLGSAVSINHLAVRRHLPVTVTGRPNRWQPDLDFGQLELRMLANLDLSGHAGGRSK